MRISVIVPTFNRAHTLPRALDSVLAQTQYKAGKVELIVVDDGSTDQTRRLIDSGYPSVKYLHQPNSGVSVARNLGLSKARGEWLAFLDSDDQWLPHKLDKQFELLAQSDLLVCHTQEQWIRNEQRVNQMNKHRKQGGLIFEKCLPLCAMSPSSIVIHRDIFAAVGGFDESLPACEDYDLWLRITARYAVAFVEDICINKYGGHSDQLSQQHWGMDRFRVIALQKLLDDDNHESFLTAEYRQLTLSTLIKKLTILGNGAAKRGNTELSNYCAQALQRWSSEHSV